MATAPPAQPIAATDRRSPSGRPVRVVRSKKRRRTIQGRLTDGVIEVRIPSWYSAADEDEAVAAMVRRVETSRTLDDGDLQQRALRLARRYALPEPAEVRWSTRQHQRWGSCTPSTRTVRLSASMATYPTWVVDYVLVHELAHLVHADHGPDFQAIVDRYPRAERARGYLIAKGHGDDPDAETGPEPSASTTPETDELS